MPTGEGFRLLARTVRSANAYEETMQQLLQSIRLGLIRPGERLPPERELAVMLGVSRDTLRDAISTLAEQGYVISKRGRYGGTTVREELPAPSHPEPNAPDQEINQADFEDLIVIRRILEIGAAREAAARDLSANSREILVAAFEECRDADDTNYRRFDAHFHLMIAETSGSTTLVQGAASVRMRLNGFLDRFPILSPNIAHSNCQHERIVSAVFAGRSDEAAETMREHLEGTEALLRGFLIGSVD